MQGGEGRESKRPKRLRRAQGLEDGPHFGRGDKYKLRDISEMDKMAVVGKGTFGEVWRAMDVQSKREVAVKLIKAENEKEGFPITALREARLLKELRHPNIVDFIDVIFGKDEGVAGTVYVVLEYMQHDLAGLLLSPDANLTWAHKKCFMLQLLRGVEFMHRNHILHRDLKCANLLISSQCQLKIADWGLARRVESTSKPGAHTPCVVTLWYRAPELLLQSPSYGTPIDMWSVGCIFGDMLCNRPILPGNTDSDQLQRIFRLCGTPDTDSWPGLVHMRDYPNWVEHFRNSKHESSIRGLLTKNVARGDGESLILQDCVALMESLLTLNPDKRVTAIDAFEYDYFWRNSPAVEPGQLSPLMLSDCHEIVARKAENERKERARAAGAGKRT
jgi:serine/threonine protein kinase